MSEEGSEQGQLVEAELEAPTGSTWPIPFNLSLNKLDIISKACFASKADTAPATLEEISRVAAVHARSTGPNLRFLVSIGVLTFDERTKRYSLTQRGTEYCKALGTGDIKAAGGVLKGLLPNSHLSELIGFIGVQGSNLTYENLFNHIKTLARVRTDGDGKVADPVRAGIRCLIGLLERAEYVQEGTVQQVEQSRPSQQSAKRTPRVAKDQNKEPQNVSAVGTQGEKEEDMAVSKTPFTINITIEAKDAEAIKQVIELVKRLRDESPSE